MGLRVVIMEPDRDDRTMLMKLVGDLGHEVSIASGKEYCRAVQSSSGQCPLSEPCCDLQIINNSQAGESGLELISWQQRHGCMISPENSAVVAEKRSNDLSMKARRLGSRTFFKPFLVKELVDWVYQVKKSKEKVRPDDRW